MLSRGVKVGCGPGTPEGLARDIVFICSPSGAGCSQQYSGSVVCQARSQSLVASLQGVEACCIETSDKGHMQETKTALSLTKLTRPVEDFMLLAMLMLCL